MHPKARGELTEAIVLAKLVAKGYVVSRPFGDNARYDMILDDGKKLSRVQVKTARRIGTNAIVFNTVSVNPMTGKSTSYEGQVDAFIAYSPDTRKMYWIPAQEVGNSRKFRLSLGDNPSSRLASSYQM